MFMIILGGNEMSKIDYSNVDFETLIIHAGQDHDPAYGALATPI